MMPMLSKRFGFLVQVECELHHDDKIGVLTLNDPFKRNALTVNMGEALIEKVDFLKGVASLRAVILTGKGLSNF
jgi:enoyl-CoA hydratase/carnithine racemase